MSQSDSQASAVDGMIQTGRGRFYARVVGQGQPVILLEAGAGDDHTTWDGIQPAVAAFTRVCSYDRAGLGRSPAALRPRTIQQMVADLQALLDATQLSPPYILVGHSLGCLVHRIYAQQFLARVAGMVCIEGPHPHQGERFAAALAATGFATHPGVQPIRRMARGVDPADHPDGLDFAASLAMVDDTFMLQVPLMVLADRKPAAQMFPDLPLVAAQAFAQTWQEMQAELVGLSTQGTQIVVDQSGHYIHWKQPQVVIDAIRRVYDATARNM